MQNQVCTWWLFYWLPIFQSFTFSVHCIGWDSSVELTREKKERELARMYYRGDWLGDGQEWCSSTQSVIESARWTAPRYSQLSDKDGRVAELANRKMAAGQIVLCNAYVAPLVEDLVGSCHLPFTLTTLLESSCLLQRRGNGEQCKNLQWKPNKNTLDGWPGYISTYM